MNIARAKGGTVLWGKIEELSGSLLWGVTFIWSRPDDRSDLRCEEEVDVVLGGGDVVLPLIVVPFKNNVVPLPLSLLPTTGRLSSLRL